MRILDAETDPSRRAWRDADVISAGRDASDAAELDKIFDRLQKRICEFEVGRKLEDAEWNDHFRPTSPASCGTVCRRCESHIGNDQAVYSGLCLMCATTPVEGSF